MHFTAHIACVCLHVCTASNAINKLYNEWPSMPVNIFDIMSSIRMGERCEVDIITPVFCLFFFVLLFFLLLCVCVLYRLSSCTALKYARQNMGSMRNRRTYTTTLPIRFEWQNKFTSRTYGETTDDAWHERALQFKTSMHNVREIDVRHVVWCPRTSH